MTLGFLTRVPSFWLAPFLCRLRILSHLRRHRALTVHHKLYTWTRCTRCGRILSGHEPDWNTLLSEAVAARKRAAV
jgi:hypothetical protein